MLNALGRRLSLISRSELDLDLDLERDQRRLDTPLQANIFPVANRQGFELEIESWSTSRL